MKAYKMFRVSKRAPGKLFPMFVLTDRETVMHEWLPAQMGKKNRDGKVMSRLGPLAFRPGWHLSDLPIAVHIGIKDNGVIRYQRPQIPEAGYRLVRVRVHRQDRLPAPGGPQRKK